MTGKDDECEDETATGLVGRLHARLVSGTGQTDDVADGETASHTDQQITFEPAAEAATTATAPAGQPSTDGGLVPDEPEQHGQLSVIDGEPSVAKALAAELRSGTVDDDVLETLSGQFGTDTKTTTAVRLDRLAARVNELETYSESIDRLAARVDELEAYTDALEELLNRAGTEEDIFGTLERLEARIADLEGADADEEDLAAAIEAVSEDVSAVEEQLQALQRWQRSLSDVFAGVEPAPIDSGEASEDTHR